MKKSIFIFLFAFSTQFIFAQSVHKHLREGNKSYQEENYDEAAEAYHKALEKDPSNVKSKFNLGNATFNSKGYDESIKNFSAAAQLADDENVKANAFYNLGNAFFKKAQGEQEEQQKILEQSVEAYKNSLRLNPQDVDAKKNLALTQRQIRKIKQQQKQQQQQQDDKKKKEKKEEDQENQDQQNQDQQDQQDQQQDSQDQQQEQKDGDKPKDEPGKDLSKEEAMELLKIMDEEEKKVQEKMRKAKSKGKKKPEKDW